MDSQHGMLESVLESQLVFMVKTDLQGNYIYLNSHFCNYLNIDGMDVIGSQFSRHLIPEDRYKCKEILRDSLANPTARQKVLLRIAHGELGAVASEWEFMVLEREGGTAEILAIGFDVTERELIELDLFAANQRLQTYINNSPLGVVEYDNELNIIQWSKRSEEIFGWKEEEILNKKFSAFDMIHEDDLENTIKVGRELMSGEVDGNVSFNSNYTKEEKVVHCIWYNSVIKDEEGKVQSILSLVQDITSRKQVEQQLIASENRFRFLIENGNDAVAILSHDAQPLYVTPSIKRVLGYNEDEAMQMDVFDLLHPDDKVGVQLALQSALENPGVPVKGYTSRMKHKNGSWRWVESTITNLLDNVHVGGIVDNFRDITERIEAEQLIKRTNRHLERAQKIAHIGYWEMNIETGENYWSDEMYHICGLDKKAGVMPLAEFMQLIHPDDHDRVAKLNGLVLESDETLMVEYRLMRKNKSIIYVQAILNRIADEHGNAVAIEGTLQDISERKQGEHTLKHLLDTTTDQNKRLKDFSFMTSHNIRSSVANLLGLTSLLNGEPGNTEYVSMISTTTLQLDRTLKNISELLNFENEFTLQYRIDCNLFECVNRIITLNDSIIKLKGIELIVEVPMDFTVSVIPAYLDSILHNLITNAIKYGITESSNLIIIKAERTDDATAVSVQDFGVGINMPVSGNKLFKLGSRLHTSSEGQGLGLFMTKHQVELMGGRIEVESEVSVGTTFKVIF